MKAKRSVGKGWRKGFGRLLIVVIGAVALFDAWHSYCVIPTEMSFSQEFYWSVVLSDPSEVELLRLVHSEMSKELAWLGTIESLTFDFHYDCQPDSCVLGDAVIYMSLVYSPVCACKNAVSSHVVTAHLGSFSEAYIEPPHTSAIEPEPAWVAISSDISSVREYALGSVGEDRWRIHPKLYLYIYRSSGDWVYSIRTGLSSPNYFSSDRLEDSDIQRVKEEKQ